MSVVEIVTEDGQRIPVPRGWVVLTLVMAAWGVASLVALVLWWVLNVPPLHVLGAAAGLIVLALLLWLVIGHRLFLAWVDRRIEKDDR